MGLYIDPAKLFLKNHSVDSLTDVIRYTDFLREDSGLSCDPPVDLQRIIDRFGLHTPKTIALPQQQGATVNFGGIPQILIREGDGPTRQRYTTAHELVELLISELPGNKRFDGKKDNIFGVEEKENICQIGAANLLMPIASFQTRARMSGLYFKSAEFLAIEYEVTLMAALCRLTDIYQQEACVVLWQMKNKPVELKDEIPDIQMRMPGFEPKNLPAPKLRVAWRHGNFRNLYIPSDKSIPEESSVYEAWENEQFTTREEMIPFGKYNKKAIMENKPIRIESEMFILSLIR
jgi:hypothetical protein